jgi:hypothetical protein
MLQFSSTTRNGPPSTGYPGPESRLSRSSARYRVHRDWNQPLLASI